MGEHMPERIEVRGAGKPGRDFIEVPTRDEGYLEALQLERTGYERLLNAGETERGGEQIADILARNAAEIVRMGGSPLARVLAERLPAIGEQVTKFLGDRGPEPDLPVNTEGGPPEGWVRDRETGEYRAPRPKGRPRRDDA